MPPLLPTNHRTPRTHPRWPLAPAAVIGLIALSLCHSAAAQADVHFQGSVHPPNGSDLSLTTGVPLLWWTQLWAFTAGVLNDGSGRFVYYTELRHQPGQDLSRATAFGGFAAPLKGSACPPQDRSPAYAGSLSVRQNATHPVILASSDSDSDGFEFAGSNEGNLSVVDDRAGVAYKVTPYGVAFNFSYDEPQRGGSRSRYLQLLGAAEGTVNGKPFTGFGGVERYAGAMDWGSATPFTQLYSQWLMHANGSSYGLLIAGIDGFSGGYLASGDSGRYVPGSEIRVVADSETTRDCDGTAVPTGIVVEPQGPWKGTDTLIFQPGKVQFSWVVEAQCGANGTHPVGGRPEHESNEQQQQEECSFGWWEQVLRS